ncbi:MAG: class I SAM-dependent methyltransferase [Lachnospiraceae bacterium]|nr:class I SAM-dependent methyltransferase [Lachnospiraceae bacterium]
MADFETIGKIRLDLSKYPGEDFYCDGAVEDELLDIVKNRSKAEYGQVIEEKKSWPILYHLSSLRENIVEWIPMKKTDKVLEVGSGCGAITGVLAKKAGQVECVELSKKRSTINAYKNEECDNVNIHVGNFKDIEPDLATDFDYICLIGVFEYGKSYIGGENPYEDFIKILMPHLKKGGRIIIAIENKLGLKYFAGCKEDHLGTYFSGIENYKAQDGVRTFSRRGLEKIFKRTDVKEYHFYYPYPDYKFMTTLYSDAYQPGKGELSNNIRNFDRDRMMLFDEKAAFDGIIEDDMFPLFSNSFIAVIGKDFDIKYVKYSNDRAPEYAIKTVISRSATKGITVRKYP